MVTVILSAGLGSESCLAVVQVVCQRATEVKVHKT